MAGSPMSSTAALRVVLPLLLALLFATSLVSAVQVGQHRKSHPSSPPLSADAHSAIPFTPFTLPPTFSPRPSLEADPAWSIDASKAVHPVSADMWGIFFEEFAYSGHGGLYQQQVRNSNFETTLANYEPWAALPSNASDVSYLLQLTTMTPLNAFNPTSLLVTTTGSAGAQVGIWQNGFWGIDLTNRSTFDFSLFAHSATVKQLTVSLTSADGSQVYASTTVKGVTAQWSRLAGELQVASTDHSARFQVSYATTGAVDRVGFDVLLLMPRTGWRDLPFIRPDLGQLLADMKPSFVRFPGGCYVEGDRLANRFNWKRALGPMEERTGHWDLWNYFSEDGLGIFEYFQWVERLVDAYGNPTRSIWVVNNGVAHSDSIPTADIGGWVQDALDSIEFVLGPADSEWGAVRARMGRAQPWLLQFVAIGNEDCGKDQYEGNYRAFYEAIHTKYPDITLISNCAPDQIKAEVQLWDYHIYTSAQDFLTKTAFFDTYPRTGPKVFNSEYAVSTNSDRLSLFAALGEAAWMTGLERNADLVTTASYAPLLSNQDAIRTGFDAIIFDHYRYYPTPSYLNQVMWAAAYTGLVSGSVQTLSNSFAPTSLNVSVSVTRGTIQPQLRAHYAGATGVLVLKVVNVNPTPQSMSISLQGLQAVAVLPQVDVVVLSSAELYARNTLDEPRLVVAQPFSVNITGPSISTCFNRFSVTVVRIYTA